MTVNTATWQRNICGILILFGIVVAILSALEPLVGGIARFCGSFGGGCKDTVQYDLFRIPIAYWGIGYYLFLAVIWLRYPERMFLWIVSGLGAEIALVGLLVKLKLVCVLCIANFFLVLALFLTLFNGEQLRESAYAGLIVFAIVISFITDNQDLRAAAVSTPTEPAVLARVAGQVVTAEEIERPLTTRLYKLRYQAYELKRTFLEDRINEILLEADAREKNTTVETLREKIKTGIPPLTDAEIDFYYASGIYRRWGNWNGSPDQVKARIRELLEQHNLNQQISDYCDKLRERYPVSISLDAPPLPTTRISIAGSPSTGPTDAPVTVVEFSDYLCPACRKAHAVVERVREHYKGKLNWVFKDFPLNIHPGARELALAARCADEQGAFWIYHNRIFSGEQKPDPEDVSTIAESLGLDRDRFDRCLVADTSAAKLDEEIAAVRQAGISSTPTLIINGRLKAGVPSFEELCALIDEALRTAG